MDIQDGARLCGRSWVYGRGHLSIGPDTWISPGGEFFTSPDATIEIGRNCDIGPGCSFITGSHEIGGPKRRAGRGWASPIRVESGCWIGAKSILLGGVTIGPGSVLAAGSVVVKSVNGGYLAAGVPAKQKKELRQ